MKLHRGDIGLKSYNNKGRGLVALSKFQADEVIERTTVLIFPPKQFETICDSRNKLGPLKSHTCWGLVLVSFRVLVRTSFPVRFRVRVRVRISVIV